MVAIRSVTHIDLRGIVLTVHSGSLQLQRDSSFKIIFENQSKETKDGICTEIRSQGGMNRKGGSNRGVTSHQFFFPSP